MSQDPSLIVSVDVEGAPLRIGETVEIISAPLDEPRGARFVGRLGIVVALVFDDPHRQYPEDPLVQVRVPGVGMDLFFPEELEARPTSRGLSEGPSGSYPPDCQTRRA